VSDVKADDLVNQLRSRMVQPLISASEAKLLQSTVNEIERLRTRSERSGAIWLHNEGDQVIVSIEHRGAWVELIRESTSGPISHIVEPSGIRERITKAPTYDERPATFLSDGLTP
jgi:hypothetical protein